MTLQTGQHIIRGRGRGWGRDRGGDRGWSRDRGGGTGWDRDKSGGRGWAETEVEPERMKIGKKKILFVFI